MKLAEIAARIDAHLKRMEADPTINARPEGKKYRILPYFMARAWAAGSYIQVCYVSFQGHSSLRRNEALEYLSWLDAGHSGAHLTAVRRKTVGDRIREETEQE